MKVKPLKASQVLSSYTVRNIIEFTEQARCEISTSMADVLIQILRSEERAYVDILEEINSDIEKIKQLS